MFTDTADATSITISAMFAGAILFGGAFTCTLKTTSQPTSQCTVAHCMVQYDSIADKTQWVHCMAFNGKLRNCTVDSKDQRRLHTFPNRNSTLSNSIVAHPTAVHTSGSCFQQFFACGLHLPKLGDVHSGGLQPVL